MFLNECALLLAPHITYRPQLCDVLDRSKRGTFSIVDVLGRNPEFLVSDEKLSHGVEDRLGESRQAFLDLIYDILDVIQDIRADLYWFAQQDARKQKVRLFKHRSNAVVSGSSSSLGSKIPRRYSQAPARCNVRIRQIQISSEVGYHERSHFRFVAAQKSGAGLYAEIFRGTVLRASGCAEKPRGYPRISRSTT